MSDTPKPSAPHHNWRTKITRLFEAGPTSALSKQVFDHVRACDDCRGFYNEYRQIEEALSPNIHEAPSMTLERISSAALPQAKSRWSLRALAWVTPLAAVPAMALMLMVSPSQRTDLPQDPQFGEVPVTSEFMARSGGVADHSDVGFRVIAVTDQASKHPQLTLGGGLTTKSTITFTYSNAGERFTHLILLGLQEGRDPIWYYPDESEAASISVMAKVVDEPLGDGFDLSALHHTGSLQIVALFSSAAISTTQVNEALTQAASNGFPIQDLSPLTALGDTAALSQILQILPETKQ